MARSNRSFILSIGLMSLILIAGAVFVVLWYPHPTSSPDAHHDSDIPQTRVDESVVLDEGTRILQAIELFRCEHGLWPYQLTELVPHYLRREETLCWQYQWSLSGTWRLVWLGNLPASSYVYKHSRASSGWVGTDGEEEWPLITPPAFVVHPELPLPAWEIQAECIRK
jgi:hypothetical protein